MVMIKRVLALLGSGALAILLLRQAETAAQAVRDGIQLCLTSVIPALFPFFAVSSLLVALGAAEAAGRALARPFGRLFRCGGAGCAALLLGLVGGYPVGARTAAELVRRGELSPAEGARLLTFCNNAGPAFAIGVAGVSVFGSARTGAWLYLLHCAAALLTGLLFCRRPLPVTAMPKRPVPPRAGLTGQFLRAVEGAVSAMARVCGFVVFFLVLLRLAEGLIGPLPPLAAGVLELTNGILRLTPDRRGFVTAAALLGSTSHSNTGTARSSMPSSRRWRPTCSPQLRRELPAKNLLRSPAWNGGAAAPPYTTSNGTAWRSPQKQRPSPWWNSFWKASPLQAIRESTHPSRSLCGRASCSNTATLSRYSNLPGCSPFRAPADFRMP